MAALEAHASDFQIRYNVTAKAIGFDALQYDEHENFYEALDPNPRSQFVFLAF